MADTTFKPSLQKHEKDQKLKLMTANFEQFTIHIEAVGNQIAQLNQNLQNLSDEIAQKIMEALEAIPRSEKGKPTQTEVPILNPNFVASIVLSDLPQPPPVASLIKPAVGTLAVTTPSPTVATQDYRTPFSGGDPCEFIQGYEEFFKVNPMTEVDMIQYVMQDFEREALEWYFEYVEENFLDTWTPDCWEDFIIKLHGRFASEPQVFVERTETEVVKVSESNFMEIEPSEVVYNLCARMHKLVKNIRQQILREKFVEDEEVLSKFNCEFNLLQTVVENVNLHQVLRNDFDRWSYWLSIGLNFVFDPGDLSQLIKVLGLNFYELTNILQTEFAHSKSSMGSGVIKILDDYCLWEYNTTKTNGSIAIEEGLQVPAPGHVNQPNLGMLDIIYGRFLSVSKDSADDFVTYIVHTPSTPDSRIFPKNFQNSPSEENRNLNENYIRGVVCIVGFNYGIQAHVMSKWEDESEPLVKLKKLCAMDGGDEKLVDGIWRNSQCECGFKSCRKCYLDESGGGYCLGCKESYKDKDDASDYDRDKHNSEAKDQPNLLPNSRGVRLGNNFSMVQSFKAPNQDFDVSETNGIYGFGNAVWLREGYEFGRRTDRYKNPPKFKEKRNRTLSRKVGISATIISPYRLLMVLRLAACLLTWRISNPNQEALWLGIMSVVWDALSWLLDQLPKIYPINRGAVDRYDHSVLKNRYESPDMAKALSDLPGIDIIVSTTDPEKEPSLVITDAILPILVDYVEKLAYYLLDDGEDLIAITNFNKRLSILVYEPREKQPTLDHNKKAEAMSALVRATAIISNEPIILNLNYDHYIYNSLALREGMCLMLDRGGDKIFYVQFPQRFEGINLNSIYTNYNTLSFNVGMEVLKGLQGPKYVRAGCTFRRIVPYGFSPPRAKEHTGWFGRRMLLCGSCMVWKEFQPNSPLQSDTSDRSLFSLSNPKSVDRKAYDSSSKSKGQRRLTQKDLRMHRVGFGALIEEAEAACFVRRRAFRNDERQYCFVTKAV